MAYLDHCLQCGGDYDGRACGPSHAISKIQRDAVKQHFETDPKGHAIPQRHFINPQRWSTRIYRCKTCAALTDDAIAHAVWHVNQVRTFPVSSR